MSEVIETLRRDHLNLAELLGMLEDQMSVFDEGGRPDYELLAGIVDYCLNYPDLHHHPMEDCVLAKLHEAAPEAAAKVGDLVARHKELGELTRRLSASLQQILNEAEVDRTAVVKLSKDFIEAYRSHINSEELYFFPAAEIALSDADWEAVACSIANLDDPLFGTEVAEEYRQLHETIMRWNSPARASA